jgi:hypothetical protein
VATWAFSTKNRFDLVALPRLGLAGSPRDASYLALSEVALLCEEERLARPVPRGVLPMAIAGGVLLAGLIAGLVWRSNHGANRAVPTAPAPLSPAAESPAPIPAPPDRAAYLGDPAENDPDERRRVLEALLDLAEQFGVPVPAATSQQADPAALMVLLADRLRYRGPMLTQAEVISLAAAPDRDRVLALRWHARIGRFAADRPLPRGFTQGPLRWQLDTLAWSFHFDAEAGAVDRRRSVAEIPHALAAALASDLPLPPTALARRHPALAAYCDFLARLPRR